MGKTSTFQVGCHRQLQAKLLGARIVAQDNPNRKRFLISDPHGPAVFPAATFFRPINEQVDLRQSEILPAYVPESIDKTLEKRLLDEMSETFTNRQSLRKQNSRSSFVLFCVSGVIAHPQAMSGIDVKS